jgi:hypothetical protein
MSEATIVIARSESDEAIQIVFRTCSLDCFASLAMTERGDTDALA